MPETFDRPSAPTGSDHVWLPRSRRSPGLGRRFLRELLAGVAGGERFADKGQLVLSELVTNALTHATARGQLIWVGAEVDEKRLLIEVHDASSRQPQSRPAAEDEESGRGLLLVDLLAEQWGCGPRQGIGKCVWCVLAPESG